jgi:hypothetical protein
MSSSSNDDTSLTDNEQKEIFISNNYSSYSYTNNTKKDISFS